MRLTQEEINHLRDIIIDAGNAIMEVYASDDFAVRKKIDKSVLTRADLLSSSILEKGLENYFPDIPILGEEGDHGNDKQRQQWEYFWAIDPLDGTKEFVEKNGQFVINIALIYDSKPIFGMLMHPPSKSVYRGGKEYGAWKAQGNNNPVRLDYTKKQKNTILRVLIDERFNYKFDDRFIDFLNKQGYTVEIDYIGSAYKFCKLAEGAVDCYPRFRGSMWWDIAAGQALVEGLGLITVPVDTTQGDDLVVFGPAETMCYNSASLVNPSFIVIDPVIYNEWIGKKF